MATQITATLPTLDFPQEVDYPTQEDWAAFSAAAELNFGILGGDWSTQMQNWKDQANAMSIELNNNADLAQSIANYQGDWTSKGYSLGQSVSVSGIYYICKLTHATGQNPTAVGSIYWNLAIGNWNLKVDTNMSGYTSKTTPVDADLLALSDSTSTFGIKKLSWANIKATLKTYFDTLYVTLSGNQTIAGVKTFSSSPVVPTPTTDFQATTARSTNITVNVGSGQTYTTINQALEYLSGFYPLHKTTGVTATINLKAGFIMNEQVLVRGLNLGWITIVGEAAETIITHTSLTTAFNGGYPAFGVDKGGTSPVIGQLFRFNVEKVGGSKHGLFTYGAGSSAEVLSGKGFIGAGTYGIIAGNGSTISAAVANVSNAGTYGIIASNGSTINAYSANASNAGTCGIIANDGSTISAAGAIIQNQTTGTSRVIVQYGSHIEAASINITGGTVPALSQTANTLTGYGIIYQ